MAICNRELYNNTSKAKVKNQLINAYKNKKLEDFTNFIKKFKYIGNTEQSKITLSSNMHSESDDIRAMQAFKNTIQQTLADIKRNDDGFDADGWYKGICEAVNMIDETQTSTVTEYLEFKNSREIADKNASDYKAHIAEFYGTGVVIMPRLIENSFRDSVVSEVFYDMNTGVLREQSQKSLNIGIMNFKAQLFRNLVPYMQKVNNENEIQELSQDMYVKDNDGNTILNADSYYAALNLFYKKFALADDFKKDITAISREHTKESQRKDKTQQFNNIVNRLFNNGERGEKLVKYLKSHNYTGRSFENFGQHLYSADHLSAEYQTLLDYVVKNKEVYGKKIINELMDLQNPFPANLLDAANAYTMLTHFDSLIKEKFGERIGIKRGTSGHEVDDIQKYSHDFETKHQAKDWTDDGYFGSEKHIAKMTQTVLESIGEYSYKDGLFKQKRLNYTQVIEAATTLLNNIYNGSVKFTGKSKGLTEAVTELENVAYNFHANPIDNLQRLLEILFTQPPANKDMLVMYMDPNTNLTDVHLDILKSLYDTVFDKKYELSFYNQAVKQARSNTRIAQGLLEEIVGLIDRNVAINWGESVADYATQTINWQVKKKYFTAYDVYMTQVNINSHVNGMSTNQRYNFQNIYKMRVNESGNSNTYSIQIGDTVLDLDIPNDAFLQILGSNSGSRLMSFRAKQLSLLDNNAVQEIDYKDFFDDLASVDLTNFINKVADAKFVKDNATLTAEESRLWDTLQFIDDFLGLGLMSGSRQGLETLSIYKNTYKTSDHLKNYLMPLVRLAMRGAYANMQYLAAEQVRLDIDSGSSSIDSDSAQTDFKANKLKAYLEQEGDILYERAKDNPRIKAFSERFNNLKYCIVSNYDDIIKQWTNAAAILNGAAAKATLTDKNSNSIPANGVSNLGSRLQYYIHKQRSAENSNVSSLMFVSSPSMLRSTIHDREVTGLYDLQAKQISDFGMGELFFHSIFNKFYSPYIRYDGNYTGIRTIGVQPTTYADKTTFLQYEINTEFNDNGTDRDLMLEAPKKIIEIYANTIGNFYRNVYNSTEQKLKTVIDTYIKSLSDETERNRLSNLAYQDVMHEMTEQQLAIAAQAAGETVELNKDYKIIKTENGNRVGINEIIGYNADLFENEVRLTEKLKSEEKNFIDELIANGCSLQVLEGSDTLDMYTNGKGPIDSKARSKNQVLTTILKYFDSFPIEKESIKTTSRNELRANFMKNWVDARTGKLILAKQTKAEVEGLKEDVNIMGISDTYDHNANIQLNPFLERYFYLNGLYSNNLRLSITGSESNHAPQKNSPFARAKEAKSFADWKNIYNIEKFSDGKRKFDNGNWKVLKRLLDRSLDVDQLKREAAKETQLSSITRNAIDTLYEDTCSYNTNTAQSTQFKRNVIIPATSNYITCNHKDGPPEKVKCCVIRDVQAPVNNYRNQRQGTIDSADGMAWITAYQCILENRALESQKVGFTKKPIWQDYDVKSGTSFLAKFATTTLTNEVMLASIKSDCMLYNLCKKMTNEQFKPEDNIDLTKSLVKGESDGGFEGSEVGSEQLKQSDHISWFNKTICDGKTLCYEDRLGDIIQITDFNKTVVQPNEQNGLKKATTLYYTKEKYYKRENSSKAKYHIFYDTYNDDGSIKESSVHMTVDTWQKAINILNDADGTNAANNIHNAHTINSLFEIHSALGGIHCVDEAGVLSEFNNEVVVNLMVNVGNIKSGRGKENYITQETYNQPLKKYQIGYAFNATAVKNGAKNINPATSWSDNTALTTFEVSLDGLGMQLNADHEVVDSEITEFSQVIAATSAYGYTYSQCNEIYQGLAKSAFQASERTLRAVDSFSELLAEGKRKEAMSVLYDAMGRILFANQQIKDKESLTNIIIESVQKIFNKYKDHTQDSVLTPFSDPNIYSDFISTLATTITKQSIKRPHPGTGSVLVPGYNMIQYFEFTNKDGETQKLMARDVIKRARTEYKEELQEFIKSKGTYDEANRVVTVTTDDGEQKIYFRTASLANLENTALSLREGNEVISDYYNPIQDNTLAIGHLMDVYLRKRQKNALSFTNAEYFMPSDIVEIVDDNDNVVEVISLDSMDKYYKFKDDVQAAQNRIHSQADNDFMNDENVMEASDFIVSTNTELAKIGTAGEYREYLSTLNSDKKFRAVYWHGSDSDFSKGYDVNGQRGTGSGAPETIGRPEMYFAAQPWSVLQYISGVNRNIADINGNKNWVRLWWDLKAILGNGRQADDTWRDKIIGDETEYQEGEKFIRDKIPNKKGEYNDGKKGEKHGRTLAEYKKELGVEKKITNKKFFEDYFDVKYGEETFNDWVERKKQEFQDIWKVRGFERGVYPVLITANSTMTETGQNTYYRDRGVLSEAQKNKVDAIISNQAANEFGTDVLVLMNPALNAHFLGSPADIIGFRNWKEQNRFPKNARYRVSTTRAHNLRPSLIRWQYKDSDGVIHYKNYFDMDHVREAVNDEKIDTDSPEYRKKVQDALHAIYAGKYIEILRDAAGNPILDTDGNQQLVERTIIDGTLENTEAELVMGNIYKDIFGIENESLLDILSQGESYFQSKARKLYPPQQTVYDLAFLKDNGKHTLVTIGNVDASNQIVHVRMNNTSVDVNGTIRAMEGDRELFRVGQYVDVSDSEGIAYDPTRQNPFYKKDGNTDLDQTLYRLNNNKIQKKISFIEEYQVNYPKVVNKNTMTRVNGKLYKIANLKTLMEVVKGKNEAEKLDAASKLQAALLNELYMADDYKMIQYNMGKGLQESKAKRNVLLAALSALKGNSAIREDVIRLLSIQEDDIRNGKVSDEFNRVKEEYLRKAAHEKWVSFQDSLKFISSRIPAQTLQSFMAMRLVGWTQNSKNMAYVSHFQTYLQGSDYDIDKAYIMGQNYGDNATYIRWSPFFDYTSLKTLEASKALPVPKDIHIEFNNKSNADKAVDISTEVSTMLDNASIINEEAVIEYNKNIKANKKPKNEVRAHWLTLEGKTEEQKLAFLKAFASALHKIENNNGICKWNDQVNTDHALNGLTATNIKQTLEQTIIRHNKYRAPESLALGAFKNVASANIFSVSHDIRNRDQAYTPIAMNLMRTAAEHSPKGEQVAGLNMLNPLMKYIMQYQNLAGKKVTGIAANGEKFWFNTYYYWNQVLRKAVESGDLSDLEYLKFCITLTMVKGRAKGTKFDPDLASNTVTHLPDMDVRNEQLVNILRNAFDATDESLQYKYVDQTISQLLSAATDNAKELILAKINADTNFAKMFIYLVVSGYDINDIAAFMTTPIAEFINSRSASNMFLKDSVHLSANTAINNSKGIVYVKNFLHGKVRVEYDPTSTEDTGVRYENKENLIRFDLIDLMKLSKLEGSKEFLAKVYDRLGIDAEHGDTFSKSHNLQKIMQAVILTAVENPNLFPAKGQETFDLISHLNNKNDIEITNYIIYCQDLINHLRKVKNEYITFLEANKKARGIKDTNVTDEEAMQFMEKDRDEFSKIFDLSSEASRITTALLGLNQGLPSDKVSMINQLLKIRRIVTDRESTFGIYKNIFDTRAQKGEDNEASQKAISEIANKIHENNPLLDDTLDHANIKKALIEAYDYDLIGTFDPIKMLTNEMVTKRDGSDARAYRDVMKEYVHYIKGMVNAIDMIYKIPHYKQTLDCFKAFIITDKNLIAKSRLINELVDTNKNITQRQLDGVIKFTDQCNIIDFLSDPVANVTLFPVVGEPAKGFNALFDPIDVNMYDLSTMNGIAGFKHFFETEFLERLRQDERVRDNALFSHLRKTDTAGKPIIVTDTDLRNPYTTTGTMQAYAEIVEGMAELEKINYKEESSEGAGDNITYADVFQLYNLIMNSNMYGKERLTATFKACTRKNSILNKYFNFTGRKDQSDQVSTYDKRDFEISIAPIVSEASERFHTEPFIKVQDEVWGYILKRYDATNNEYYEDNATQPYVDDNTSADIIDSRKFNYSTNIPFDMPYRAGISILNNTINFKPEDIATPEDLANVKQSIKSVLVNKSQSRNIQIITTDGKRGSLDVQVEASMYDEEVNGVKTITQTIGNVKAPKKGTKVVLNYDDVVDMIVDLSAEERNDLYNLLKTKQKINYSDIIGHGGNLISNITLSEIFDAFPLLTDQYKFDPKVIKNSDNMTLIRCTTFKDGGKDFNGLMYGGADAEGNGATPMWIIKSIYDAVDLLTYLQCKEKCEEVFTDDKAKIDSKILDADLVEKLDIIRKNFGKMGQYIKSERTRLETMMMYLKNKSKLRLKPFSHTIGRGKNAHTIIIEPSKVLSKIANKLTDLYMPQERYSDLDTSVYNISKYVNGIKGKYSWYVNKKNLYECITTYFPPKENSRIPKTLEDFNKLTVDELNDLLWGEGGLFLGEPKLSGGRITNLEIRENKVKSNSVDKYWAEIVKAKNTPTEEEEPTTKRGRKKKTAENQIPSKIEDFLRNGPEEELPNRLKTAQRWLNEAALTVKGRDGADHVLKASIDTENNKIVLSYEDTTPSLEIEFDSHANLGKVFNFGNDTKSIFSLLSNADVAKAKEKDSIENSMYKGIYIRKVMRNNKLTYVISRSIPSAGSKNLSFASIDAATYYIDNEMIPKDTIWANSLYSIKQADGVPRYVRVELDSVYPNQILTVLTGDAVSVPKGLEWKNLPSSIQNLMGLTVPQFKNALSRVPGIEEIDTPEEAAAFLFKAVEKLRLDTDSKIQQNRIIDQLRSYNFKSREIIDAIKKAPRRHFYVEDINSKTKMATLRLLENMNGETLSLDDGRSVIGDRSVDAFVSQTLDTAINYFNRAYHLDIRTMSVDDLVSFGTRRGLSDISQQAKSIRAFIYTDPWIENEDGTLSENPNPQSRIYINTSVANASDLYHEMAHIFLGVLKATNPEAYTALINAYRYEPVTKNREYLKEKDTFRNRLDFYKKNLYKNFAEQDIAEEVVATLIAKDIFNNGKLNSLESAKNPTEFEQEFNKIWSSITDKIKSSKSEVSDNNNGLGFNSIFTMIQTKAANGELASTLQRQRVMANFIRSQIAQEKIKEIC